MMAHPGLLDPGELARQVAAERVARSFVGKSAKARRRETDELAERLLPLCEAVTEGLSPLMDALAGLDGLGGIGGQLRKVYDAEQARRAEVEARVVRPQFRDVSADDLAMARFMNTMMMAAEVAPRDMRIPRVNGSEGGR